MKLNSLEVFKNFEKMFTAGGGGGGGCKSLFSCGKVLNFQGISGSLILAKPFYIFNLCRKSPSDVGA